MIQPILYLHVFSGGTALLAGLIAIATKKGSKQHITSGNIYFWSMLSVIITGLVVGFFRNNIFLQSIAIFSFYMAFTGKRFLRNKKEISPKSIDWFVGVLSALVGLSMLGFGVYFLIKIGFRSAVPMLLVFGFLLSWMTLEDLKRLYYKQFVKGAWLLKHISRMGGSFIATSTAFLLVNTSVEPVWVMWLLPTFIGTPMIVISIRSWTKKLKL
ncbi:MAG: hypothetical protein RJQ00_12315 [Vicingaceae bacterium]